MEAAEVVQWFNDNRDLITVNSAEKELGMPRGTLNLAIQGTRNLPKKYVDPLTVLMDSLTAAPRSSSPVKVEPLKETEKKKPVNGEPVKIAEEVPPMLQRSEKPATGNPQQETTRTETTASGIVIRYRNRYPTFKDINNGDFRLLKNEGFGKPKTYFNGLVYMRTGNHKPARFAFIQSDLK